MQIKYIVAIQIQSDVAILRIFSYETVLISIHIYTVSEDKSSRRVYMRR